MTCWPNATSGPSTWRCGTATRPPTVFLDWKAGVRIDGPKRYREWFGLVPHDRRPGVQIRRVRIVSEPLADFIRFEYDVTVGLNVAAGEQVRWLPRRQASDLALPGNDFWGPTAGSSDSATSPVTGNSSATTSGRILTW